MRELVISIVCFGATFGVLTVGRLATGQLDTDPFLVGVFTGLFVFPLMTVFLDNMAYILGGESR